MLDRLGLTAQKGANHLKFSNQSLNAQLFLQRIDGQDQINHGSSAELSLEDSTAYRNDDFNQLEEKHYLKFRAAIKGKVIW